LCEKNEKKYLSFITQKRFSFSARANYIQRTKRERG
jgi:hypothetical protein